jgi:carbonic anhydrase
VAELDTMLDANAKHAAGFAQGGLGMPPARAVAIAACMDARLHPAKFLVRGFVYDVKSGRLTEIT